MQEELVDGQNQVPAASPCHLRRTCQSWHPLTPKTSALWAPLPAPKATSSGVRVASEQRTRLRDTSPGHGDPVATPSLRITGNLSRPVCSLPHQAAPGARGGAGTRARSRLGCGHGPMLHPGGFALALPPRCWAAQKSPCLGTRVLDPVASEALERQVPRGIQLGVGAQQTSVEWGHMPGPACTPGPPNLSQGPLLSPPQCPSIKFPVLVAGLGWEWEEEEEAAATMESSMKQVVLEEEVSPCRVALPPWGVPAASLAQGFAQFIPARQTPGIGVWSMGCCIPRAHSHPGAAG